MNWNELDYEQIAKEYEVEFRYLTDDDVPKNKAINMSFAIGKSKILLGKYDNKEQEALAFFHKLAHCIKKETPVAPTTLQLELDYWFFAFSISREKYGVVWSDTIIEDTLKKCLAYDFNKPTTQVNLSNKSLEEWAKDVIGWIQEAYPNLSLHYTIDNGDFMNEENFCEINYTNKLLDDDISFKRFIGSIIYRLFKNNVYGIYIGYGDAKKFIDFTSIHNSLDEVVKKMRNEYPNLICGWEYDESDDFYEIWHTDNGADIYSNEEWTVFISEIIYELHKKNISNFVFGFNYEKEKQYGKSHI